MVPVCTAQLAARCRQVPVNSAFMESRRPQLPSDYREEQHSWYYSTFGLLNTPNCEVAAYHKQLQEFQNYLLCALLSKFRRTYIIIDGVDVIDRYYNSGLVAAEMRGLIQSLLEQDFGNVSIAIFSRPTESLTPVIELADVSIHLLKVEAPPSNLREYTQKKIREYIKPAFVTAGYRSPGAWSLDLEDCITGASDGL